jgi:hypothetical protein
MRFGALYVGSSIVRGADCAVLRNGVKRRSAADFDLVTPVFIFR